VVQVGEATVAAFRLFPGIRAEYLRQVLAPPVQGLVLECFGSGNAPVANRPFMDAIREAAGRVVIVDVPQPLHGSADLSLYATGRALAEAGVVSGYDMTAEAALAKLFFLFDLGLAPARVKELMPLDLRGELTPPDSAPEALRRSRRRLARAL
jgi:L-asparaginase